MKIDSHIHITPRWLIEDWETMAAKEPYFSLLSHSKSNRFACAEDVIAALDGAGVDRAVVFGFAFREMAHCQAVNDYTMEAVQRYPDRLIGLAVVPPTHPDMADELARCESGGLRGVGELFAEGQGFSLTDEVDTRALMGICREQGWPLLLHGNEAVGHPYPGKTSDTPERLAHFVENYPDNTIILAHWGGGLCFYALMPEMRNVLKNVYFDTAATPYLYDPAIYDTAKTLGLLDRILFGSDFPLLTPLRTEEHLRQSGLCEEELGLLLGGNAQRIFGYEAQGAALHPPKGYNPFGNPF